MSFIDCRNLVLGYDGNVVSRDINFSVEEGDYLCILGENGADDGPIQLYRRSSADPAAH